MYIQILNFLLIIILIALVAFLSYNIYLSTREVKRYEPPEFEGEKNIEESEVPTYTSKITMKTSNNFTGFISFKVLTTNPENSFAIDWGNGLSVPYTGSSFVQKLPPMFYPRGNYTISIYCNNTTFKILDYITDGPDLEKIEFNNIKSLQISRE